MNTDHPKMLSGKDGTIVDRQMVIGDDGTAIKLYLVKFDDPELGKFWIKEEHLTKMFLH